MSGGDDDDDDDSDRRIEEYQINTRIGVQRRDKQCLIHRYVDRYWTCFFSSQSRSLFTFPHHVPSRPSADY